MLLLLLAVVAVGFGMLTVAGAATLRAESVTAADAAALAGGQEIREGLGLAEVAIYHATREIPGGLVVSGRAAAADYAGRNGGRLSRFDVVPTSPTAVRVSVAVETTRDLDGERPTAHASTAVSWRLLEPDQRRCMTLAEVRDAAGDAGLAPPDRSGLVDCNGTDTVNLQPKMKVAILQVEDTMGGSVDLASAYRSVEEQAVLYRRCLEHGACPAAPPGASLHNYGLAVDVRNWRDVERAVAEGGIPLCNEVPNDEVHFSHADHHECGGLAPLPPPGVRLVFDNVRLVE